MAKPLRVLLVEDREKDLELLVLELRRGGFDVAHQRVETAEAFVAALDGQGWDLILCDYNLPHFSAPAALALVKEKQIDLPFIVVSGTTREEEAVVALRAGAHDFVAKSKLSRLLPAIDRELRDAESRAERKKTQELLIVAARDYDALQRASAARLSLMFGKVPVILYTYAVEESGRFRFTSVNPAFLTATGLTEDAVVGRLVDEIVPEPSLSLVLGKYRDAIRERATVRWTETTPYPTGTRVAEVTITPIFDDAGRCTELFGTVYDLTEIEQIKEELRASEEQKEELAVLNRRLAEATQAKSEFLANMSHELRTPLNAILGFSDLLTEQLDAQLSTAQKRFLRNVRESGEHLLELINDVLDLSKVEAGRLELRAEVVRIAPLLEPVVASARASAGAAGLAFEAVVPDDGVVRVDPLRLRQVLDNLLSNAVKFTPRGSVRLVVRFEGAGLVVEVTDTGLGIPASERHRVFGTFERLHEGRVEATGTGLGLALTKRLVELHRGSISFESEEGRGTTFRLVLPETRVEPVHGDRVLVVEDVEADADLIVALAAEAGLQCEVVTTTRAAIDAAREDPPRAVVLDLRLPDERGERVLEALKAEPRTRGIPVIVVTVEDDEGRSRPLGADDHLTKPVDRQRLASWLRGLKEA